MNVLSNVFKIAKGVKIFHQLSIDNEQIKCDSHTMEYYTAIKGIKY